MDSSTSGSGQTPPAPGSPQPGFGGQPAPGGGQQPPPGWLPAPPPWPPGPAGQPGPWTGHPGYAGPAGPYAGYPPPGYYPAPKAHTGRNIALAVGGGCLVLLLLAVAGGAVLFHAASNAPLSNFPTPANCQQTGFRINAGNGQSSEMKSWECDASRPDVQQAFNDGLPRQGWVIDGQSTTQYAWRIHRAGHSGESGTITFSETGPKTTGVEVTYRYP